MKGPSDWKAALQTYKTNSEIQDKINTATITHMYVQYRPHPS